MTGLKILSDNKTIKNVLLWIAVLPASLLGMGLAFGLWRIIYYITVARIIGTDSWLSSVFIEVMSNLIAGTVFVLIGYYIAPSYKKITATVLTILMLIVGVISLFIVNFILKEYFSNIGIIAGLFGLAGGCISAYEIESKNR